MIFLLGFGADFVSHQWFRMPVSSPPRPEYLRVPRRRSSVLLLPDTPRCDRVAFNLRHQIGSPTRNAIGISLHVRDKTDSGTEIHQKKSYANVCMWSSIVDFNSFIGCICCSCDTQDFCQADLPRTPGRPHLQNTFALDGCQALPDSLINNAEAIHINTSWCFLKGRNETQWLRFSEERTQDGHSIKMDKASNCK